MEASEFSSRWSASLLAVAQLMILALAAESLMLTSVAAARQREKRTQISQEERSEEADAFLQRALRSDIGAEIVGGVTAPQGKYNFMAFVLLEVAPGAFAQCGGSLINQWYVLTAAHCVTDEFGNEFSPDAFVMVIGKANWPDYQDENVYFATDVSVHPGWDPDGFATTADFANDVAVLELDLPVPTGVAKPVQLVGNGQTKFDGTGQTKTIAGWGTTSQGGSTSDQLRETQVNIVSDSACQADYAAGGGSIVEGVMICAAFVGRDSCQGDSGGPLFANEIVGHKKKKKGKKKKVPVRAFVQMGIVSWGFGCADPDFPGVYTEVSAPGINNFIVNSMS